jgi:phosphate transport system permease protein
MAKLRVWISRALDFLEWPIQLLIRLSGWSAIFFVAMIFLFIILVAAPILPHVDWMQFFFENNWLPTPAEGNEEQYGALAMFYGTASVTILGMLIAIPLGLGAAIYISEFATGKVKETLKVVIELLAAIPSIVWGFIGLAILGPLIGGINLLTAGIIIALMSVPMIVSIAEDSLRAVPDTFREAAIALGASRWEMIRRVLFPAAKSGLLAACMLGVGRAIGETMAVLMASGNATKLPKDPMFLFEKVRTLTATIASEMSESAVGGTHYQMLFVIGLVLLIITVIINVVSDLIVKGIKTQK